MTVLLISRIGRREGIRLPEGNIRQGRPGEFCGEAGGRRRFFGPLIATSVLLRRKTLYLIGNFIAV